MNKCQAITKKGTACINNAKNGEFCGIHSKGPTVDSGSTITITYCNVAENHVGMEKIGSSTSIKGFQLDELKNGLEVFSGSKIYDLRELVSGTSVQVDEAYLFVAPGGADILLKEIGSSAKEMFQEQMALEWDKKILSAKHGGVVNKNARWNLCYADYNQSPAFEQGKGTVVSFDKIPRTSHIRKRLGEIFGPKAKGLVAEGNLYYDVSKTGIGYHGDAERDIVVGIRLGKTMSLHYQWYVESKPVGRNFEFALNEGDIYVMSEKAVGKDWHKKKIPTLRHAAGCKKYTDLK